MFIALYSEEILRVRSEHHGSTLMYKYAHIEYKTPINRKIEEYLK